MSIHDGRRPWSAFRVVFVGSGGYLHAHGTRVEMPACRAVLVWEAT